MNKKKVIKEKPKQKRIRLDRILIVFSIFIVIVGCFTFFFNIKISNIYITNNSFYSDQKIIELAGISLYPATFQNLSFQIENRLEKDLFIKDVKVTKKGLTKVYIDIVENRPLFYNTSDNKTILLDGTSTVNKYPIPTVLNYITDTYFDDFIIEMGKLDIDILNRISEIQFVPNEVDDNRFLLSMNDGNYVYINIATFNKLNKYISIIENLPSQKGILNLDYGNNFEIIK